MKRFDCGNQRTGHPRCAQLMAKTWKFWPSMFRPQQGISAVSPSHPFRTGLRYVARRVWPAGNSSSPPSDRQSIYPPARPRATGDMRYRTIGTARMAPTMKLKNTPILTSIARLDTTVSVVMVVAPWCRARQGSRLLVLWETVAAALPARARRQRFPAPTWGDQARCCASRALQVLDDPRSQSCEVADRSPGTGTTNPRWSWP